MVKKYDIEFAEAVTPITEHITKFGGQPVWLTEPQWPLSQSLGEPMQFICQISLDTEIFGEMSSKMAYVFMTDNGDVSTWEADGGENAVVLQPGNFSKPTAPLLSGNSIETLYLEKDQPPRSVEYSIRLTLGEDADFESETERMACASNIDESQREEESNRKLVSRIGGTPGFLQSDEFPDESGDWKLLLQLDSANVPFFVNFGDAGIGYVFIDFQGTIGKFLWQCG